jgi:biopolymer transport protein ExbB/TolQ
MGAITSMAEMFKEGGWPMWPILGVLAFSLAVAVERFIVLRAARSVNKDELLDRLNARVLKGDLMKAISIVGKSNTPLTKIVQAGLTSVVNGGSPEEVQTAMDAIALREIPKLEKRTGLLATAANVATLIGLLGTVLGLIGAFAAVASASPVEKGTLLGAAIAESMNCTAFGLIVAIPALGAFGYLSSTTQELVDDIHETAVSTLNFILANRDKITKA